MKCEQANLLIMSYMDEEITEVQAKELNAHLLICDSCKESFKVFDFMLAQMEEIPAITAPEGFEQAVMEQVLLLPQTHKQLVYSKKDKMKMAFVGSFAFLLSIGAILISYRGMIIDTLVANPFIGDGVERLIPAVEIVEAHTMELISFFEQVLNGLNHLLSAASGLFVVGIVGLCGVQAVLAYRRNR